MMIGNMGEVASLTDKLALMPDQQLPRLAQQYKGDAITLSLILGEKNRRERVRQAMTAQAGAQPQPKVNDQIVASMQPQMQAPQQLPENVGIGALPAQNMQHMADGGIVGYDDGGVVGYADGGPNQGTGPAGQLAYNNEPVMRMAEGGVARFDGKNGSFVQSDVMQGTQYGVPGMVVPSAPLVPQQGDPESTPILRRWYNEMKQTNQQYQLERARSRIAAGVGTSVDKDILEQADASQQTVVRPGSLPASFVDKYRAKEAPNAPAAGAGKTADTATAGSNKTDYSVLNTSGAPRAGGAGIGDLSKQYGNILKAQTSTDPAAKERADLQKQIVTSAEEEKAGVEAAQKASGDVYKGREERLSKREQELEKSKQSNEGLALLEAGLSIMSTPGHWSQAIGQGARAGVARYAEGIDKLRAAQERLGDARDRMEDLKINRDDMNSREIRQANSKINSAKMDAQKLGIDAIMARDNVNRDTAGKIFNATVQQSISAMEIQGRKDVAGMPSGNERIALLLGGGSLDKGLTRLADIQAGKFNPMTAYTEYVSKRKEGDTVLSPAEFVSQIKSVSALMAGPPKPVDASKADRS